MTEFTEDYHFTHDAAVASLDDEHDAITTTDSGETEIDWEEVETVRIDDPPYAEAFDTKEFYKLPVTAARPINQTYHYGSDDSDGLVTLRKPRSELKRSAWSLDRRPVTLGHPDTQMVKNLDDIHGFWSDIQYIDSTDDLDTNSYIPVNDDEAQEWIEGHTDVSVGFHHKVVRPDEYDGTVGGTDDSESVDGFQTDIYHNHCAFVGRGRCPSEKGCGLDSAGLHGKTVKADGAFERSDTIINEGDEEAVTNEAVDAPQGIYESEGAMYGISPDENPDGEPKYELNNCSDVSDAWKLRGHGDYSVEQSTLETRIKRMAEHHGCDMDFDSETDAAIDSVAGYSISECDGCGCNENDTIETMTEFDIDISDLSAEAALQKIGQSHDGVAELAEDVAEMQEIADEVKEVTDTLDTDMDNLSSRVDELKQKADAYDEARAEEMRETAEEIASMVDKYEDAEAVIDKHDGDADSIEDELEILQSAVGTDEEDETEESETTQTSVDSEPTGDETEQKDRVVPEAWS